jgi:hypothetical protein
MAGRISYLGGIVKNGLVLHLDAGKIDSYPRTGTLWRDLSGNGNNGTLTNFGSQTIWNGDNGGSIIFDGTNDYNNLGNNFNFEYNNSFTLCGWFKFSDDTDSFLIYKQESSVNFRGWVLRKLPNYQMMIGLVNTVTNQVQIRSSINAVLPNNWYYLCGSYNGNTLSSGLKLYSNGVQLSTTVTANNLGSRTILNSVNCLTGLLKGNNSIVNIYNRELSSQEVLQNYNALKGRYNL